MKSGLASFTISALVALVACKQKNVPFNGPPKDDAATAAIDAGGPTDARQATAKRTATKLAIGDHMTCAILSDAALSCWGKNNDGQLGNGTTTDSAVPVALKLRGVIDVAVGTAHGCALLDDTSVACWGRINFGPKANLLVPTAVPGLKKVTRLFAVGGASCASIADESLVCWGDVDVQGHLRTREPARASRVATPFAGLDHVVALTANGALHMDGTVSFWGADGAPVRTALADVRELASIGDAVCGLRGDGSTACVTSSTGCAAASPKVPNKGKKPVPNKRGGKVAAKAKVPAKPGPVSLPVEVLKLPRASHLAFDAGICVVTVTGKLECLTPSTPPPSTGCTVEAIAQPPRPGLANVDMVAGSCARTKDGAVRCWPVDRKKNGVAAAVAGITNAISIVGSASHACARLGDTSVACWGSNRFGALGRGEIDEGIHVEARAVTF